MRIAAFYENLAEGCAASGVSPEKALKDLQKDGLSLLYLSPESWEKDGERLRPLLEETGIGIEGLHAVCDFTKDPDSSRYREVIDLAASLHAGNVLLIPGFLTSGNTLGAIRAMTEGMRRAARFGEEKGIPVLMEDYDGLLAPFNSIAGLGYFLREIPSLGCAFDTGNFCMFHEDELLAFGEFADRIRTVHLKDRSRTPFFPGDGFKVASDLEKVYPAPVGYGYIRIAEILDRLRKRGYPGNVIVEHYDVDPREMLGAISLSVRWVSSRLGE